MKLDRVRSEMYDRIAPASSMADRGALTPLSGIYQAADFTDSFSSFRGVEHELE